MLPYVQVRGVGRAVKQFVCEAGSRRVRVDSHQRCTFFQTGNLHIAIYDHSAMTMHLAFAGVYLRVTARDV